MQSCATCEYERKLLCDPIRVERPSPVAVCTVTCSRNTLSDPISRYVFPPEYFRSCVFNPMLANGKNSHRAPIVVNPSITTCECSRHPSPNFTFAPTKAKTAIVAGACVLLAAVTTTITIYNVNKPIQGIPKDWSVLSRSGERRVGTE